MSAEKNTTIEVVLDTLGITELTPMQRASLEMHRMHERVVLLSPTGSGKTLAFLLPLLSRLKDGAGVQALVVAPSRELALQIEGVFRSMRTGRRITCCYGGHRIDTEERSLRETPAVVVGTPGRILHHIRNGSIDPATIGTVVLDEFDKSLEFGFHAEMEAIMRQLVNARRRTLTSATSNIDIPAFAGVEDAQVLDFLDGAVRPAVRIMKVISTDRDKLETLYRLICHARSSRTLVFANHRESTERIAAFLDAKGIDNEAFHGGMDQDDRERALAKFRGGSSPVIVSTDLAARGLDIPQVEAIIHYHLPTEEAAFIHRNGRTARMNALGTAYVILHNEEAPPAFIAAIEESITLPAVAVPPPAPLWQTLYIGRGSKEKLSKTDVVGFLCQKGGLAKDEIGVIEIKDHHAYVAVRRSKVRGVVARVRDEPVKGRKAKIAVSK